LSRPSTLPGGDVFLATTALEDFWDTSKPLLFLSDGCRRYSRRSVWERLDGSVLETPWSSTQAVHDAYHYVSDAHERLLPLLAQALNDIHGRQHNLRYWRIFLGPWLTWYLNVAYDRYRLIRQALESEPNLTTIGLDERCFVTPRDTYDFILQILDDPYNLQLCTKIMTALGLNFPRKKTPVVPTSQSRLSACGDKDISPRVRLKRLAIKWRQVALETLQNKRHIILKSSYFSRRVEALLWIKTGGRLWINITPPLPATETATPLDRNLRDSLRAAMPAGDEFAHVLSRLMPEDLPRCFVEDYGRVEAYARAHYPPAPRAIFSANDWYFDEAFKHWSGVCAAKGTQLLGTQHGGYGIQRYMVMPSEAHELEITDRYYTWGWQRSGTHATTVPLPGSKLIGRKRLNADNKRTGILFVLRMGFRFMLEFPYSPDEFSSYLHQQKLFIEALRPSLLGEMKVRPHYNDLGWDVAQQWQVNFPDVKLETWEKTFRESLADCRLYVTDHLSTTYLEALAADKPSILFWKPDISINRFNSDAQDYFDELRSVGILHDTPESAAHAVGQVYGDVESWWNEPRRQSAVERFREHFARTSIDELELWAEEFKLLAGARQSVVPSSQARK
jgi:putative transferase (TIGR04331 family)